MEQSFFQSAARQHLRIAPWTHLVPCNFRMIGSLYAAYLKQQTDDKCVFYNRFCCAFEVCVTPCKRNSCHQSYGNRGILEIFFCKITNNALSFGSSSWTENIRESNREVIVSFFFDKRLFQPFRRVYLNEQHAHFDLEDVQNDFKIVNLVWDSVHSEVSGLVWRKNVLTRQMNFYNCIALDGLAFNMMPTISSGAS